MRLPGKQVLLLGLAALLSAARVRAQGLFPPLYSPTNFATSNPVTATSTCTGCEEDEDCQSCNNTCPYGDTLPQPLDLMASGMLQAGVVSISKVYGNCFLINLPFSQSILGNEGPEGAALYQLDGGPDSFVNFSSDLSVEPSQGFTIAGWISQQQGNEG